MRAAGSVRDAWGVCKVGREGEAATEAPAVHGVGGAVEAEERAESGEKKSWQ